MGGNFAQFRVCNAKVFVRVFFQLLKDRYGAVQFVFESGDGGTLSGVVLLEVVFRCHVVCLGVGLAVKVAKEENQNGGLC